MNNATCRAFETPVVFGDLAADGGLRVSLRVMWVRQRRAVAADGWLSVIRVVISFPQGPSVLAPCALRNKLRSYDIGP